MIMVVGVFIAILTVPLCGGRFSRLGSIRLRWGWTIMLSLLLQIVVISLLERVLPDMVASGLHLVSYALAAAFLWGNRRTQGVWVVALGGVLNVVPIVANGGVMPARAAALAAAGKHVRPDQFDNSTVVAHAKVAFLGDVFVWPEPLPLANVFSIGDLVLMVGVGLVLHGLCGSTVRRPPRASLARPGAVLQLAAANAQLPPATPRQVTLTAAGFAGVSCASAGSPRSVERRARQREALQV